MKTSDSGAARWRAEEDVSMSYKLISLLIALAEDVLDLIWNNSPCKLHTCSIAPWLHSRQAQKICAAHKKSAPRTNKKQNQT